MGPNLRPVSTERQRRKAKQPAEPISQKARGAEGKKKKRGYLPTYLFLSFFEIFRSDFRKYFYGVFGLLM
jgi:hypothetical protein